jgi:hypothetical protein
MVDFAPASRTGYLAISNMIPLMTPPTADSPITFKSLGREKRSEVLRLANRGDRHPDPAIAAAAYGWSHAERWNTLANRLPGWLLPSVGIVFVVLIVITGLPAVFIIGGVLVVVLGCLGWMSTSSARAVRAVYSEQTTTEA